MLVCRYAQRDVPGFHDLRLMSIVVPKHGRGWPASGQPRARSEKHPPMLNDAHRQKNVFELRLRFDS